MTRAVCPAVLPVREHAVTLDALFGWISDGSTGRGVILCGTYGYEQHCAHRPWRELAHAIAASGCSVLRFSYPGAGDSSDAGADRLEGWIGAIRRAVSHLREAAGATEIVLVGLRLGGTLAALAAHEMAVDRLVLLEPFVTGRAFLREMALQGRVVDVLPDGRPLPAEKTEGVSVGGFHLHAAMASDLRTVDLATAARAPAPDILIMGAERSGLGEHYRSLGATVATAPFPDLADLCANALTATMSEATRDSVVAFATRDLPAGGAPQHRARPTAGLDDPNWREEPIRFGAEAFAIHCRPPGGRPPSASVLFLNMGLHVHSGHGRQTTDFARRLARLGVQSLRIDLRGVGDSPARPDNASPMYNLDALDDVRAALDVLTRSGPGPVVVLGVCSGAYLAFHAACQDPRIGGAVLVNLYCFDWALTHGDAPYSNTPIRTLATYSNLFRHGEAWQRLLSGRTPVFTILAGLARRFALSSFDRVKRLLRRDERHDSIPRRIARLRARGGRLALLYSAGDLGLVDLQARLGHAPADHDRILGTPVRIMEGADHVFCAPKAQQALFETLQTEIAALRDSHGGPAVVQSFRAVESASPV